MVLHGAPPTEWSNHAASQPRGHAARDVPVQRNREADHGSVSRAGLHQALTLQLLGAVLHAGHAVAAVQPAVELERNALAVVLDPSWKSPLGDGAADRAARRAAVLDDVADRLAQDARGLHVGARRQRLRQSRRSARCHSPSTPACDRRPHDLGAPVAERVDQPHRLAGQAAHRQPHLLQRLARQRRDALALAGVHDGQQLGAEVVVQVGGDALALLLRSPARRAARPAARSCARSAAALSRHARLERIAQLVGAAQGTPVLLHQQQAQRR